MSMRFVPINMISYTSFTKLSKFKMIMIARIADFGHYRNMMQSGFISKVMEG